MIIGLAGKKQSGKNTVAKIIQKNHSDFILVSFGGKMKDALIKLDPYIYLEETFLSNMSKKHNINYMQLFARANSRVMEGVFVKLSEALKYISLEDLKLATNVRELLQRFGTEVGRDMFGQDFWIKQLFYEIGYENHFNVVITDVRFDNEAKAILDNGGIVINIVAKNSDDEDTHISEKGVSDYLFNDTIHNDGTLDDLEIQVNYIMEKYKFMYSV